MKVVLAESAGFCYGVRRALDTVLAAAKIAGKPMFTLGPLIHNPQVIERLAADGVASVNSLDEIPEGSIVIMPSHGVPIHVMEQARARGLEVIDVTCPFVAKVHLLAAGLVKDGYQVLLLGDSGHTEVRGIQSVCGEDSIVIADVGELDLRVLKNKIGILAQTTETVERYQCLVRCAAAKAYEVRAYKTICNATMDRQKSALDLTSDVDVMIVVGGRNSANTRRLAEICTASEVSTHHIEVASELDSEWFTDAECVGITAGASTPDWIINEVVERVKEL